MGFDVYNVTNRNTKQQIIIKVFKSLKLRPEEHQTCIFNQIQKTLELQYDLPKFNVLVQIYSYFTANNNVYVTSELCAENLK